MSNKLHIKPQPPTEDERRQQAMRLAAQKYESFYTGLVFNMVQNPAFDPRNEEDARRLLDNAKMMTDQMMAALYAPKAKEEE